MTSVDKNLPEEQLVELRGERSEEAPESGYEPAHHRRHPGGLAPAEGDGHWRYEEGHPRGHGTQPSWKAKSTSKWEM